MMAKSDMKEDTKMDMVQDKKMAKKAIGMHDKQMHGGKKTDLAALKKGGDVKKMLGGGLAAALGRGVANAVKQNPNMGGTASLAPKPSLNQTGMKKGGKVSSASSRGDGCAQRGKTKGRMI